MATTTIRGRPPVIKPLVSSDIVAVVTEDSPGVFVDHRGTMDDLKAAVGSPYLLAYDSLHDYSLDDGNNITYFGGIPYKSLSATNTGNQPDTSPTFWEVTGGGSGGAGVELVKNTLKKASVSSWAKGAGSYVSAPAWSTAQNLCGGGAMLITFSAGTKGATDYVDGDLNEIMTSYTGRAWKLRLAAFMDAGATFADNDLIFEYFDGTVSSPIGVATVLLNNNLTLELSLLPTNTIGTSSRLRIRAKTGSTTCVGNLRIADVSIVPSPILSTPALGPYQNYPAYTYPFPGGSLAVADGKSPIGAVATNPTKATVIITDQAKFARNGEFVFLDIHYHHESSAGASAGSGLYLIPAPAGLLFDIIGIELNTGPGGVLGLFYAGTMRIATQERSLWASVYSSQFLRLHTNTGLDTDDISSSANPITTGVFEIHVRCSVKISSWSNNLIITGVNEPFYLSNTESVVNTNGVVGKTYNGIEGSLIPANTATTYYDMTLLRSLLPNETPVLQLRSKANLAWVDIDAAVAFSTYPYKLIGVLTSNVFFGAGISLETTGQLRMYMGVSAGVNVAGANLTWAALIALSGGYDRWRISIGQASVSEQVPKIYAEAIGRNSFTTGVTLPIPFDGTGGSVPIDTHGSITASTGRFKAPIEGYFDVCGEWFGAATGALYIYKNGVQSKFLMQADTLNVSNSFSRKIKLMKDDYIDFRGNSSFIVSGFQVDISN